MVQLFNELTEIALKERLSPARSKPCIHAHKHGKQNQGVIATINVK